MTVPPALVSILRGVGAHMGRCESHSLCKSDSVLASFVFQFFTDSLPLIFMTTYALSF